MIQILITSSVLIAVIALARLLLRKRVSQRLIYGLWLLVALRLLIPIQFGQSSFSVAALTEKIETNSKPIQQIQEGLQQPIVGPSRKELYDQLLNDYLLQYRPLPDSGSNAAPDSGPDLTPDTAPISPSPVTPEVEAQIQEQVAQQLQGPSLQEILLILWIGGVALMALWFLIANLAFLRKAKRGRAPWEGSPKVWVSPNVPTPCLVGLFRPRIYLTPDCVQDPASLEHVLTHERCHLRQGDHIWSLVRCVCLCVYWFDPLVWLAAILSKRDCELACDEAALKRLGDEARIPYGKTLLATVSRSRSPAHIFETATAMSESKKQLKERMCFIVKKPKTLLTAAIMLILVAAIVTGCAFSGGKPGETPSTSDPTKSSTAPNEPSTAPDEPEKTEPTEPSTESTEPLGPPSRPSTETGEPALVQSKEDALELATVLIEKYRLYDCFSICCEFEGMYEDMSQYMTPEQMDLEDGDYHGYQYKITCCHTLEEMHGHARWFIDDALIDGWADDHIFTDGESLYLPVIAMGGIGYDNIKVEHWNESEVVAYADCYAEADYCDSVAFHIVLEDGRWYIKDAYVYAVSTEGAPDWFFS